MDFILALHSHLPYVLHHGRWPHGSDWLCEAALDTYLPLLDMLQTFERDGIDTPVTLGITPVLANQLAHPSFREELEAYISQRLEACDAAPTSLAATGDAELVPLAAYWRRRLTALRDVYHASGSDLIGAFRGLQDRGRLELISSAATHGFLPMLGRDESIRLQLFTGRAEHRRLFGRAPDGCWLPECAFRPAGPWQPKGARPVAHRRGTDEHLRDAGYRFFFVDAHLVAAGDNLGAYHDVPLGAERFDAERHDPDTPPMTAPRGTKRSPYLAYRMPGPRGAAPLAAFVRDPRSSMQVWSRQQGYPGDEWYLEFHKIRWPGGLKLWRVTSGDADLGAKRSYDPDRARGRAREHARHFASLLHQTARQEQGGRVIVAPFDTELFGHWWFEGVDFLGDLYRSLGTEPGAARPVVARAHDAGQSRGSVVTLAEGSWGANGDFSMWSNEQTAWTWKRLWPLEDAFWAVAPAALKGDARRRLVLAQAARSLLLAQSSDWQFIISTGAATDYAEHRFVLHADDAEHLVAALKPEASAAALEEAVRYAERIRPRDDLFPDVLDSIAEALG
jgi:1,4-alpha-glucan branching enzyme